MEGVYAATDFWWTLRTSTRWRKCSSRHSSKKYGYKPEWGANNAYMQFAMWADAVRARRHASTRPTVIKAYEAGQQIHSTVGDVYFRAADHQLVRPGHHRPRQGSPPT